MRAGSDWCTLCYTDLRPVPATPVAPEPPAPRSPDSPSAASPAVAAEVPTSSGATTAPARALPTDLSAEHYAGAGEVPAAATPRVRRGKHARTAPTPDQAEADALAAQLLARLAVEESGSPLGALTSLTESSGKKVALMVGGAGAIIVVLIALMALLGLLF